MPLLGRTDRSWYDPDPDDPADLSTGEKPFANLAPLAGAVESGDVRLPPRRVFERTPSGTQVWTTPNGRTFECDDEGRLPRELPPRDTTWSRE